MIDVVVDANSLDKSRSGVITGGVWVRLNSYAFPEVGWSDSVVAFLLALYDAIISTTAGSSPGVARFFEGPYLLKCEQIGEGDQMTLRAINTRNGEQHTSNVEKSTLLEAVGRAAQTVIRECDVRDWSDGETAALRRYLVSHPD